MSPAAGACLQVYTLENSMQQELAAGHPVRLPCVQYCHDNESLASLSHALCCRTDSWVWCDDDGDEEAEASGQPARRIADALLSSG